MPWNWQQPDWPAFTYDPAALEPLERQFLLRCGEFIGAFKHVGSQDQDTLKIELISEEAIKTSEIEGEVLNRDSVQSSLRQQFGLATDGRRIPPAERGIAEMMVDLYKSFMNARQEKAIARMFREGIDGFKGCLSAENYISITRSSRATATRYLQDFVAKGALSRIGELRHTRYHLSIPDRQE